ncbi:LOW QUALITY PROTEIN: E3 ubiquitin/ISG15 ligase TRIM25-like [Anomaloglossus baeobatrachus]
MASAGLRKELECSICLNLYTDPVILRCGHNFCRTCIDQVLNTQDESGVYCCPECREEFQERPVLIRNITLCNILEDFLSTQADHMEITGICCTYCIHSPAPAVRSCLHCEASLCDNHLRVHSKGPEHVLTDPRTSLENRKCSVHKKILEYYCTEDAACICVSCCLIGEHRGHKVELLDEASEKRKTKLRNFLQTLTTKREKTVEKVWRLEENWRKGKEKMTEENKTVTALFIDIRRWVDDLEKRILSEISRREEQVSLLLSSVIQKLEIKSYELSRKMRHIEELCNMTDPLAVLQDPDTEDLCDPEEDGGDEDTGGHDGGDRGAELISHIPYNLCDIIRDINVTLWAGSCRHITGCRHGC